MKNTLTKLLVLLLVLAMAASLTACANKTAPAPAAEPGEAPAAEAPAAEAPADAAPAPEAVDTSLLRVGVDGEPTNLSPADAGGSVGGMFYRQSVFDTLWMYTSDGEFHYMAAESYEFNADDTVLTIKLHENGKFADGTPVTAEDVLASLNYEDQKNGDRTASIDFEKSHADGDYTLVLGVERKATTIEDLALISIQSKAYTKDFTDDNGMYTAPMGSGPYKIDGSWTTGSNMILVKNENYWDAANVTYDKIEVHFINEETTRYLSFQAGELDICYLTDSKNVDEAAASYSMYSCPVQLVYGLIWDTLDAENGVLNQNIRLAICHAVDVPTLVTSIAGSAFKPASSILPSTNWAYKDTAYTYDPELAKQYFDAYCEETGNSSFTFKCSIPEENLKKSLCEAIQGYLAPIGITMEIETLDFPSFFGAMMNGQLFCTLTQYSGSYDPGGVLNSWMSFSAAGMNHMEEPLGSQLDEACTSLESQEARTEMFHKLQDDVAAYGKMLPIAEGTYNYAIAGTHIDISHSVMADGYLSPYWISVG